MNIEALRQNPRQADKIYLIPPLGVELLHFRGRGYEYSQAGRALGISAKRLRNLSTEIRRGVGAQTELGAMLRLIRLGGMDLDFLKCDFDLSKFSGFPPAVRRVLDALISPLVADTSNKGIAAHLGISVKNVRNLLCQTYSLDDGFNRLRAGVLYFIYSEASKRNGQGYNALSRGFKFCENPPHLLYMEADSIPFLAVIPDEGLKGLKSVGR